MNLTALGKLIILFAAILSIIGGIILLLGALGISKLPGDIFYKKDGVAIYIPTAISILLSVILTIIINVIIYLRR